MVSIPQGSKAGSVSSLPFFLMVALVLSSALVLHAREKPLPAFEEFESSCIDLGHYDPKMKQLTVRFVNPMTERFYRYSNVPAEIWKNLRALNKTGGVGSYLNDEVVRHPEKYPFTELSIRSFKLVVKKKKAGN